MEAWEEQQQSFGDARANIRDMMGAAVRRGNYYVPPKGPLTNFAAHTLELIHHFDNIARGTAGVRDITAMREKN